MSQDARRAKRAGKVVLQFYKKHASYFVLAAKLLGVKFDVDRELMHRVTMVRIGVRRASS